MPLNSISEEYLKSLESIFHSGREARPTVSNWPRMPNYSEEVTTDLRAHHHAVARSFFKAETLNHLKLEIDRCFGEPECIQSPIRVPPRTGQTEKQTLREIESLPRLSEYEVSLGTQYLKENTSYIQLKTPLKNVAALLPVILDLRLLRTAQEYLGCFPLLTYVKVQRTWANQLPETNTQLWHIDIDAFRMLKAFIFLDEIDSNTGVTRFIEGSHFFEQGNYHYQDRWSEEDIENKFPFARRVTPKLAYGDMLLLDTLQLHRGARPRGRDRTAIIANFCAHPEQASGGCLDMREKDFKALHTLQKRALTT